MPFPGLLLLLPAMLSPQSDSSWSTASVGHGLTVSFPQKPSKQQNQKIDGMGNAEIWAYSGMEGSFVTVVAKFSPGLAVQREVWEAGGIFGICQGDYDRIVEEKEELFNGWPAIEVTVKKDDGSLIISHGVKIDSLTISMLSTVGSASRPANVDKFFSSLRAPSFGNGPLQTIGPKFGEYQVGTSGIYAKFPHPPEEEKDVEAKEKNRFFRFGSIYVDREFQVGYGDVTSEAELAKTTPEEVLKHMAQQLCDSMGGKDLKTTLDTYGKDPALSCEMTAEYNIRARAMIILKGKRLIVAVTRAAKVLLSGKDFTDFLHSIRY